MIMVDLLSYLVGSGHWQYHHDFSPLINQQRNAMAMSGSQDSLIHTPNGSNNRDSTPDLVRLDGDNLDDIIVSLNSVHVTAAKMLFCRLFKFY